MRLIKSTSMFLLISLIVALPGATSAETPRAAKPEDVGISSQRLQRIHELVQHSIDAGNFSGAVTLVARNGKIAHFEAQGLMDIETNKPIAKDTMFRIMSSCCDSAMEVPFFALSSRNSRLLARS